jgi:hypothetical protein
MQKKEAKTGGFARGTPKAFGAGIIIKRTLCSIPLTIIPLTMFAPVSWVKPMLPEKLAANCMQTYEHEQRAT